MHFDPLELEPSLRPTAKGGFLAVPPRTLTLLSREAFTRISFTFSEKHLSHLIVVANDPNNTPNDRMVSSCLLENAIIASDGILPLCQDTGTAQVFAWKDSRVLVDGSDAEYLANGASLAYGERNLRYSTTVPNSLFTETDPGNNMPAQIFVESTATPAEATPSYRFLFCAKGGGSANKTKLTQATKSLLNEVAFTAFLEREIAALGTSACPPYTIGVVVGGISPEQNLLALKLATAGLFDSPLRESDTKVMGVRPLRIPEWEDRVRYIAERTGLGAQFGGKAMAVDAIVLRLPRHGASCPVSIGVSCSAHRNLFARIDADGVWLERTVSDPRLLPGLTEAAAAASADTRTATRINLDGGIATVRAALTGLEPGTPVLLSGTLLVARDAAHARWKALLDGGQELPDYVKQYAILYAGPAKTPVDMPIGSFGPTTAGRMDEYAEMLMSRGAALVTLAKGNRSAEWAKACQQYGGFYLGTMGGTAALIASRHIESSRVIDYPELGMEAVRLVTVRELPAFVLINDQGADFYRSLAVEKRK